MNAPPENALLMKNICQCLLLANVLCIPLRLFLFGFCLAEVMAGLFPLACFFLYLPLRCKALRLDINNFFEYFEEE